MENFIVMMACLVIGMALKRIPVFPQSAGDVLNLFVIYVSLPALVLREIPKLILSKDVIVAAVMPWGLLILTAAMILVLAGIIKWSRETVGCLLLLIPLGNTSFLGIPMVRSFFGAEAVPYALIYDQLGTFLALGIYGTIVVAVYGNAERRLTAGLVIRRILSFPPFVALVLAFATRMLPYPGTALKLLDILSATLVPLVMVAVGFQLSLRLERSIVGQLSTGLFIKLIAVPLMAFFICKTGGLEGPIVQVSVFQAGMPPMVTAGSLAITAKLSPDLAAGLAGIGIIVSFVTLPLLYQML